MRASNQAPRRGSSPLARGTRNWNRTCLHIDGLIPARAGNTGSSGRCTTGEGAHPRSRGEHATDRGMGVAVMGSSPLARGTPDSRTLAPPSGGLIPARAGNTVGVDTTAGRPRAHPRSRGEHIPGVARIPVKSGSSPLARGTLGSGLRRVTK